MKKNIAKNTFFLYIRMFLTMGVSLYTSRVVLNVLGASDYGAYSVIGGVVSMFAFFNMAMATSTQRFLSFEIGTGNFVSLRKTFNASVNIHAGIALLILILAETFGLWFLNNKLNIDPDRIEAGRWVFHFAILSFMVTVMQVPYNALIIARERMNVYAVFSIIEVFLKLGVVYLLAASPFDKLKSYAVLMFGVTLLIALVYRIYCIRYFRESRYVFHYDRQIYRRLISFFGWNLFGNLAAIARGQGSNIILNIFFGTIVNAAYGITSQVSGTVKHFVTNFQVAVNPQIIKTYAQGNLKQNHILIFQSSKLSYFLLFIVVCPIWFNIDFILRLWLVNPPPLTAIFIQLALINILIDCLSGPIMTGIQASGNIKWYQIIVGLFILLDLPLTYIVLSQYRDPVLSYVATMAITSLSLILRLYFLSRIVGVDIKKFSKQVLLRVLVVTATSGLLIFYGLDLFYVDSEWIRFISNIAFITIINIIAIFSLGLSKSEVAFLKRVVIRR